MIPGVMSSFPGGSAYSMARDIAEGYHLVTERTFKNMARGDVEQLAFELDRCLRDVRGEQVPLDNLDQIKGRNRKIQRLNQALMVLRNHQQRIRKEP
jgi:hypothetical protein